MPNWVRNQIIFKTKEDLNKALELCGIDISLPEKEPKMMDFGVLVPMPKILDHQSVYYNSTLHPPLLINPDWNSAVEKFCESGSINKDSDADEVIPAFMEYLKKSDSPCKAESFTAAQQQEIIEAVCKKLCDGHKDWYDWSIAKWGCKWNANLVAVTDYSIVFDTPWNYPGAWLDDFAMADPSLDFYVAWADEDIFGGFSGILQRLEVNELTEDASANIGFDSDLMGSMFSDALWNGWNQMSPRFEEWWTEAFPKDSDFSWQKWEY